FLRSSKNSIQMYRPNQV
ncbi:radical SAM superfamily protein, partial [Vibrio parahaemolyticus V-223/04]